MGVEASVAHMVGSALDRRRTGLYRRCRRKLYRAGCRDGQAAVALSSRRVGVFVAHGVRHRWKGVRRGSRRLRAVHVWPAINASKIFTRSTSQLRPAHKSLRNHGPCGGPHIRAARAQPTATRARTRKLERRGRRKTESLVSPGTSRIAVLRRLSPPHFARARGRARCLLNRQLTDPPAKSPIPSESRHGGTVPAAR